MKSSNIGGNSTVQHINEAVRIVGKGGVISFPTETYYGLGVNPFDNSAVEKLFELKKRARNKPILLLIADVQMLSRLVTHVPLQYQPLIKMFWPGPLTLIFKAKKTVNSLLTGATGTVGIRISSHPIVKEIINKWGGPITATSANISDQTPAKNSIEVLSYFGDNLDYIIDGGESPAGLCSTIVAVRNDKLSEIREGQIPFKVITQASDK